jgi:hypothetical protein
MYTVSLAAARAWTPFITVKVDIGNQTPQYWQPNTSILATKHSNDGKTVHIRQVLFEQVSA